MFATETAKIIETAINSEKENAIENYGPTYNSDHEGYAVLKEEIEEQAEHQACAHIGISAYKRNPDAHSLFKTGFRVGAKFGMKKAIEGHKVTTEKISIVEKENAESKYFIN